MSQPPALPALNVLAERVGALLRRRGETVAVAESSTGGLVSAALLALPGASAYFVGGAVVYTLQARKALLGLTEADLAGMRPSTEAYAALIARQACGSHGATWGLGESGAAGPTGNRYGDAAGHVCLAVAGRASACLSVETGDTNRAANMDVFARHLLNLFEATLLTQPST
ncbi:damage-inducible protein [Rhodoferax koreense]|uniref:Damage-inducible protein n=1 Tax=Rhodoferax koreensis TaxID=1842727 RepID=A0A1P8K041_9BURK|nr:CinA family protein [Rhodoferax koreense]APW39370.1 damage-inducible protein [Rhodoferax koreense]